MCACANINKEATGACAGLVPQIVPQPADDDDDDDDHGAENAIKPLGERESGKRSQIQTIITAATGMRRSICGVKNECERASPARGKSVEISQNSDGMRWNARRGAARRGAVIGWNRFTFWRTAARLRLAAVGIGLLFQSNSSSVQLGGTSAMDY